MSGAVLRVGVVGGGVGGLCLAHGLVRAGVDVTVYERDASPRARGQGYRLHIDGTGSAALRECLPPALYQRFADSCYRPATDSPRITVLSSKLRVLKEIPLVADSDVPTGAVDRQALRDILRDGLGERLRFGWECTGFAGAAPVRVDFAGGRTVEVDVLVAADGTGSRLRRQYLPGAVVRDTGEACVFGRTPLDRVDLPAAVRHGFVAAVDVLHSRGMALGALPSAGYLMWALTARRRSFRADLDALRPEELTTLVQRMIRRWHPELRALVAAAEPDRTAVVPIRIAEPVPPWPSTAVTLLGDAIHAMSPSGGSGANTALRDAAVLSRELAAGGGIVAAIARYEAEMIPYGFAAVARSRRRS